jgi:hydroxylaminobenzene mutase
MPTQLQRKLAALGATLFAVGMVTGLWTAVALTGKITVPIPHLALAAHLNALLGGFWMLVVAWSLPMLRYGDKGKSRVALGVGVSAWGNWAVTLIASFWGVVGLEYTGNMKNNAIAAMLQGIVVVPGLIASIGWAWGFWKKQL